MTSKLLEPNSIPIPPHLAGLLKQSLGRTGNGFDEGVFLQQLHYWTLNPGTTGWIIDDAKWIFNSLKAWQEQFPWMTEYGLRKAIANLKKLGLIQTAQHWISQYKRVMFYRIDYDRLNQFAGALCEEIAFRGVEGDRIDVMTGHNTDPETSSDTSFPEQQTDVVLKEKESEKADGFGALEDRADSREEMQDAEEQTHSPESSGNDLKCEPSTFPELRDVVVQAIGLPSLPTSLKLAIERFPERVKPAIAYLHYQQQKRKVENPVGYLYEAIISDWNLSVPGAIVPPGFGEWFDRARAAGLVVAAMIIDGVHHTLHRDLGWVSTARLMQLCSSEQLY